MTHLTRPLFELACKYHEQFKWAKQDAWARIREEHEKLLSDLSDPSNPFEKMIKDMSVIQDEDALEYDMDKEATLEALKAIPKDEFPDIAHCHDKAIAELVDLLTVLNSHEDTRF